MVRLWLARRSAGGESWAADGPPRRLQGREDSGVDKNSALSSSVLDLPYRGQGTLRGADFFDPDELVPRLYEIFRMYSASGDAGSLLALEWMGEWPGLCIGASACRRSESAQNTESCVPLPRRTPDVDAGWRACGVGARDIRPGEGLQQVQEPSRPQHARETKSLLGRCFPSSSAFNWRTSLPSPGVAALGTSVISGFPPQFHQFIECLKAVASRLRRSLNEIVEQLIISLYPRVIHALKRGKDPATVPAPSPEASPPAQGATQPPAGDPDTSYGTSFAEDSALDGERGSDHGDPTAPSKQVAEGGEERRTESSDAGSHQVSDAAANGAAEGAEMMSGRGGGEGSVIDGADAWGAAGENISLADGGGAESDDVRAGVDGDSGIDEVVDDAGEVVDEVDEEDDLLVDEEFLTEAHARNAFIPPDTPMRGVAA